MTAAGAGVGVGAGEIEELEGEGEGPRRRCKMKRRRNVSAHGGTMHVEAMAVHALVRQVNNTSHTGNKCRLGITTDRGRTNIPKHDGAGNEVMVVVAPEAFHG